jgi:Skp family chaperone for outer membrane proteins
VILIVGIAAFVSVAVFLTARRQHNDAQNGPQAVLREQEKGIQERDHKIEVLEAELKRVRQQLTERSEELQELSTRHAQTQRDSATTEQRIAEWRAKYEQSQRDLAVTQARLEIVNRQTERLASSRAEPVSPPPARAPGVQRPTPATPSQPSSSAPAPSSPPPPTRRVAEPGTYETVRATTVYEEPSGSSRALSQISRGTRVAVVRSVGDWLEVRSRHGNPPGYIRLDDAMFVSQAN